MRPFLAELVPFCGKSSLMWSRRGLDAQVGVGKLIEERQHVPSVPPPHQGVL